MKRSGRRTEEEKKKIGGGFGPGTPRGQFICLHLKLSRISVHGDLGVVNHARHHSLCPGSSRSHCDCRHKCCGKQSPPQWPPAFTRPACYIFYWPFVSDKTLIYGEGGGVFLTPATTGKEGSLFPQPQGGKRRFIYFFYFLSPPVPTPFQEAVTRLMPLSSRSDFRGHHSRRLDR